MPVLLSLAAATAYAGASVLQQREAAAVPAAHALHPSLLGRLVRRPRWLAGLACDAVGFVLQAAALRRGSLVVVQLLLTAGLLVALPLGARRWLRPREWSAAVAVAAGLTGFVVLVDAAPHGGTTGAASWLGLLVGTGTAAGSLVLVGRNQPAPRRACAYAVAAGIVFAASSAVTKSAAVLLTTDVLDFLTRWQPWALVATAGIGMLLVQSAFQAAPLAASLPALTIAEPVAAAIIGIMTFAERPSGSASAAAAGVLAGAAAVAGAGVLARAAAHSGVASDDAQPG